MGDKSKISWTQATWNPVVGCSKVSPGCVNCYAEELSLRRGWTPLPWTWPNAPENVQLKPERLAIPLRWKKPRMIFVNSMSDLFHELVPFEFIAAVFGIMSVAEQHTFQVLTKRPGRALEFFSWIETEAWPRLFPIGGPDYPIEANAVLQYVPSELDDRYEISGPSEPAPWPLPNVWLGTSVEDQRRADERIPWLLRMPAAVRFLSCEPLLGPIRLDDVRPPPGTPSIDALRVDQHLFVSDDWSRNKIDWVIVGGESGPKRRPMDLDWARSIRDQCVEAGVPLFFKQGNHRYPGKDRLLDGRTWDEMPERVPA